MRHRWMAFLGVAAALAIGVVSAALFSETFPGSPPAPLAFSSEHWDVTLHSEWGVGVSTDNMPAPSEAQHTIACGAPGETGLNTHTVQAINSLTFKCADHLMTHVPTGNYAVIYLTPDQMLDFSGGTASLRFDVSTLATSTRDWIDVWVQAWDTQEQAILDAEIPTSQGNPRNAVHIESGGACGGFRAGEGEFHVEVFDASRNVVFCAPSVGRWIDVLTPSAMTRTTVEVLLSPTHVRVWLPQFNKVLVDSDIPTLGFTQGVVQLGHHNYSADKGEDPRTGAFPGVANTWHWDNVTINPSVPFGIVQANKKRAHWEDSALARTFTFAPAPANSYLRFEAFGEVNVSANGGTPFTATRSSAFRSPEQSSSYFTPIPQGTTSVRFDIAPAFGFVGGVRNPVIFSRNAAEPTASPSPTPTSTPTSTPTATPTATSTPTATPTATPSPTATATPNPTPDPRTYRCQVRRDNGSYQTVWTKAGGGACP